MLLEMTHKTSDDSGAYRLNTANFKTKGMAGNATGSTP